MMVVTGGKEAGKTRWRGFPILELNADISEHLGCVTGREGLTVVSSNSGSKIIEWKSAMKKVCESVMKLGWS
jgi:hypothetical protein